MASRNCDSCAEPYEAKRPSSRFCSERCRKRAQRAPGPTAIRPGSVAVAVPVVESRSATDAGDGLASATRTVLAAAQRLATPLGQAALLLAERIERASVGLGETGTAFSALVREHRVALAEALKGAQRAADPVDELRAARDRKRRDTG